MSFITSSLATIQGSPLATMIAEGDNAFPWLESIHVVALVIVFGTVAIVDLRLLGVQLHRASSRRLMNELIPITWGAFAVALVTGSLMFMSRAGDYAANVYFVAKMCLLLFAGANMALFHRFAATTIGTWDEAATPPVQARRAAALSLLTWTAIIVCGRWIGFTL